MKQIPSLNTIIHPHYPELIEKLAAIIRSSEQKYCRHHPDGADSFLWEHTVQVASIAAKLAIDEGHDPLLPVIAALFHDCGKFNCGCYHEDDTPEEEHSARQAKELLAEAGMPYQDIQTVIDSLIALYNEDAGDSVITAIVHDADFLSKSGPIGVANFFTKAALRGRTMRNTILQSLSKELTYAFHLTGNMRTTAGRDLARSKQRVALDFYKALLLDLRISNIAELSIREFKVQTDREDYDNIDVMLVIPDVCPNCRGKFTFDFSTRDDIKCTKLIARSTCSTCGDEQEISFCLPEIREIH